MTFNVSIERDQEQILAIYIKLREGKVARTVEIEDGACYADEDAEGQLLGVEMLAPGLVGINIAAVKQRYPNNAALEEVLDKAIDTVNI